MPADYRIITTPNGTRLKARIVDPNAFGLGTQLDRFYQEHKTEPSHYTPMAKPGGKVPANHLVQRNGSRRVHCAKPVLSVV